MTQIPLSDRRLLCLLAMLLLETGCLRQPAVSPPVAVQFPAWRASLKGVEIPRHPLRGRLAGVNFLPDRAVLDLDRRELRFEMDLGPWNTRWLTVGLPWAVSRYEDDAFVIDQFGATVEPAEADLDESPIVVASAAGTERWIDQGYALKLAFNGMVGSRLRGEIYLCLPGKLQSVLAGQFSAVIRGARYDWNYADALDARKDRLETLEQLAAAHVIEMLRQAGMKIEFGLMYVWGSRDLTIRGNFAHGTIFYGYPQGDSAGSDLEQSELVLLFIRDPINGWRVHRELQFFQLPQAHRPSTGENAVQRMRRTSAERVEAQHRALSEEQRPEVEQVRLDHFLDGDRAICRVSFRRVDRSTAGRADAPLVEQFFLYQRAANAWQFVRALRQDERIPGRWRSGKVAR